MDALFVDTEDQELVEAVARAIENRRRAMISAATKRGLARAQEQGVKLGRPERVDPYAKAVIISMRKDGYSFNAIARSLDARGIRTPYKADRWYGSTVQRFYQRYSS